MGKDNFQVGDLPDGDDELRARLAELDSAELSEARDSLQTEFDKQYDALGDDPAEEQLAELEKLGKQLAAANEVKTQKANEARERRERAEALRQRVSGKDDESEDGGDGDGEDGGEGEPEKTEQSEAELVEAVSGDTLTASISTAIRETMKAAASDYLKPGQDLNQRTRFNTMKQYAPDAKVHEARSEAVITASADIPGFAQGGQIESLDDLAQAFHNRARSLPVSRSGDPDPTMIGSLQREYNYTLNENATPKQVNDVLKAATDVDVLTAAGGWCAPSEISYDFYNIVCEDGQIDLPTVGLNRGGTQYPTSPSFGDLAGQDGIVWTWTEQDDIDAVDSASIIKPCVRLECPTFQERRKDCDGFCVTAGNLVDFAYPELVANWLQLVTAIRAHATNARIIDLMINGGGSGDDIGPSLAVDHTGLLGNITAKLLTSIELTVTDYREKFAMCDDAVLEGVFPRWAQMVIRADIANRDGIDVFSVTDGMIADWFNLRDIRAQFVGDWQVRSPGLPGADTALTALPAELDYMVFAPGTFVRGNGMTLDLGVVRDSTLNEQNDHTAAWVEECYALLKPGHESRLVTVDVCAAGNTGADDIVCAS